MAISLKEELLRSGNVIFTNKGISMKPLLRQGKDLMIIEKRKAGQILKENDVVLFERPNGDTVLHRIVGEGEGGFYILGDNCIDPEFVPGDKIIGVLTGVVRNGKKRINVTDPGYLRYVRLWRKTYPVRRIWLKVKAAVRGKLKGASGN